MACKRGPLANPNSPNAVNSPERKVIMFDSKLARIPLLAGLLALSLITSAQSKTPGCIGPSGNRFNLEPRANAVVQTAQSVAFLPGAGENGADLVVGTGNDARGISTNPNATIIAEDAFYVQRSDANCAADFEGGLPTISNATDQFSPFGSPVVVADAARKQFFIVDARFGDFTDDNGVGIVRSDAKTLLNATDCPSGTEVGTANCWPLGAVTNITTLNAFLSNPHIAVDERTSGKGAGDVYTVVTQADPNNTLHTQVSLTACTNGLNCGNSISISGSDLEGDFAWVQVRPDGSITISYRNTSFPGINPEEIKFVNCTPNGAPNPPTCSAPVTITTEHTPAFASFIGNQGLTDLLYPKHVHRLEADGHTVTTFLVYDRCSVPVLPGNTSTCPKTSVALTSSSDGGASWAPVRMVTCSPGHQFFGSLAADTSTGTVNIAYYSTEKDPFHLLTQVFVAQVPPGMTTVGGVHQVTTDFADPAATSPAAFLLQPSGFGNTIGIAAARNRAYVSFTYNTVNGTYNGVSAADVNNHLASFYY